MVDQASETLFLQDNLLSEDDWGGALNLVDLKDLTSSNPSSASDGFCLDDEARYQEEYASQTEEAKYLASSNQDTALSASSAPNSNFDFVDELLQDLFQDQDTEHKNVSDEVLLHKSTSEKLERRFSTNTASSSAYSSCSDSGTPSPTDQFSDHGSCSSGEYQDQETLTIDLTAVSDTDICPPNSANWVDQVYPIHEKKRSSYCRKQVKSRSYVDAASTSQKLAKASELEKAVRLACQETNRLLQLHKRLSGSEMVTDCKSKESKKDLMAKQQDQDMLKSLCEETILSNPPQSNGEKIVKPPPKKPQKRRSSTLQDAIDRLQSGNKSLCLNTERPSHSTPFSRSALVNGASKTKLNKQRNQFNSMKSKESYTVVGPPQQLASPYSATHNGTAYTFTPASTPTIQFYVKQESPTFQPCSVVSNFCQPHATQNVMPVLNHKVFVSTGSTPNLTFAAPSQGISVVKPEQILCNTGQTIVIQQPAQNVTPPLLKPINISSMKPGSEPMVLSQSDLSRLALQGVIKFPIKKTDRNLMPVSDENKMQIKNELKAAANLGKNQAIFPAVCDVLPNEAAGIINGTSVLINGVDNQPQRGELNVKALKRHQRMIKNRASACESRQRRKEYLKTLEDQATEVAEENTRLRGRNEFLLSRVHELEVENKNLKDLIGVTRSNQKKTAFVFMLVLLVGINIFPSRLFGSLSPTGDHYSPDTPNGNMGLTVSSQSQNSLRPGRHLLSLNGHENTVQMEDEEDLTDDKSLVISRKQSYWMDDLVQQYKDKHLENFLQLLSETTSNSVKRMLRRKLKEELGIMVPLPVPRSRRIAYTPLGTRQRIDKTISSESSVSNKASFSPKTTPTIRESAPRPGVKLPSVLPHPCEHSEKTGLNETETSRVNQDLTQWAKRYTVDRQEKAEKTAEKNKPATKKLRNTKAPSSRYEDHEKSTSTSEIALYARPNKMFDDFLDAINRRNDTFYVVSLNRDHLLLPATVQNTSSRMKMALVMPAITSKDHSPHGEYETMMHIECEVRNTWMFDLKRQDVPEFLNSNSAKVAINSLESSSNETLSQDQGQTSRTGNALHPSKRKEKRPMKSSESRLKGHKDEQQKVEDELPLNEEDAVVSDVADPDFYKGP